MIQHRIQEPFTVEQKQPYDKYDIAQNTGTIPVEQKQPYDKYDIVTEYKEPFYSRTEYSNHHCRTETTL